MFHHFPAEARWRLAWCAHRTSPTSRVRSARIHYCQLTQSGYTSHGRTATYLKNACRRSSSPTARPRSTRPFTLDPASLENLPAAWTGPTSGTDLDGEGLSGILTEQGRRLVLQAQSGRRLWPAPAGKRRSEPRCRANLEGGAQQLLDLAGDGSRTWSVRRPAARLLRAHRRRAVVPTSNPLPPARSRLERSQPALRRPDGDGHADLLTDDDEVFTWYPPWPSMASARRAVPTAAATRTTGPALVFADGTRSIFLADMSGDGLTDLVRIRNGEVCYWPNLGYGRFGAKVTMDDAPWFDHARPVRPAPPPPGRHRRLRHHRPDLPGPRRGRASTSTSPATLERRRDCLRSSRRGRSAGRRQRRWTCSATARPAWSGPRPCRATPAGRCATST